jgi:hypothetical protein
MFKSITKHETAVVFFMLGCFISYIVSSYLINQELERIASALEYAMYL